MNRKKNFYKKPTPLWAAVAMSLVFSLATGAGAFYLSRSVFSQGQSVAGATAEITEEYLFDLSQEVIPASGYTTGIKWGDLGKRLVEVGAIDPAKYDEIFDSNTNGRAELAILLGNSESPITINENNSRFVVNTLWALGLVNKSKVLDEGPMMSGQNQAENMASTAGWTLGTKPAMELYSSEELVPLTDDQQDQVIRIAENVYRPCCGNSTAFPDCNHGMAALGYIQLAVASGISEEQIYKDLLAFNSYWFPQTYVQMAAFFDKEQKTGWSDVDAKLALSAQYSSVQGAQQIQQTFESAPALRSAGGSCGA